MLPDASTILEQMLWMLAGCVWWVGGGYLGVYICVYVSVCMCTWFCEGVAR